MLIEYNQFLTNWKYPISVQLSGIIDISISYVWYYRLSSCDFMFKYFAAITHVSFVLLIYLEMSVYIVKVLTKQMR